MKKTPLTYGLTPPFLWRPDGVLASSVQLAKNNCLPCRKWKRFFSFFSFFQTLMGVGRTMSGYIIKGRRKFWKSGGHVVMCWGQLAPMAEMGLTGLPKTGTGHGKKRDRAWKDVLKQENDVLKQKMMFYNRKGCSKTGNLVIFFENF